VEAMEAEAGAFQYKVCVSTSRVCRSARAAGS
jgi:hypothetical protein